MLQQEKSSVVKRNCGMENLHYAERIERDLEEIGAHIDQVSDEILDQIGKVLHSFVHRDFAGANEVVLGDRRVNRKIQRIDEMVHSFVVRHAPSGRHLRYASAVLRLTVALERIGDYAGSIGRQIVRIESEPPERIVKQIEMVAQQARYTLEKAIQAFKKGDVESARETYWHSERSDHALSLVFNEVLDLGTTEKTGMLDILGLSRVLLLFRRMEEQAENLSEQTVFAFSGEQRKPRVFRVLFLDEKHDREAQVAESYARKAFSKSGVYDSAGWNVQGDGLLEENLVKYMDGKGLDLRHARSKEMVPISEMSNHFHVVVVFSKEEDFDFLGEVPFRTTVLRWDPSDVNDLDATYRHVAGSIQKLMTILSGVDAS